jgi:hypothetical protein
MSRYSAEDLATQSVQAANRYDTHHPRTDLPRSALTNAVAYFKPRSDR